MELKIVYHVLRKISDWSLEGFYSDVYVEGQENVTREGPLIIASTHHNEIIDIATLAATIPYRRYLSFWAKSSMFTNPLARTIMLSSGAIPVRRNPNNGNGNGNERGSGISPQISLFRESSMALAHGDVIGVFPEGTSYTSPSIMQVMSGAAWAAVDYVKWAREQDVKSNQLTIVPVGIVYTDKARYQSRVCVRYGEPILVKTYMQEIFEQGADVEDATKTVVKQITSEIERQMRVMSINAPDWDTLYAAQMARDIVYEDSESIPLKDWVSVSQNLVDIFTTSSSSSPKLGAVKTALTTYYSLLHYTGISHSSLVSLLPINHKSLFIHLLRTILHVPLAFLSFILFLPPMILHVPAYIMGSLAAKVLAEQGEVEAVAQFKAIFGGVGLKVGLSVALGVLRKYGGLKLMWKFIVGETASEGLMEKLKGVVTTLGLAYSSVYLLVRWHNALVRGNYKRLKTLLSVPKLCLGLIPQHPVSPEDLERYHHPPAPPPNPFIKKKEEAAGVNGNPVENIEGLPPTPRISARQLIRPLLEARKQACSALEAYLETEKEDAQVARFLSKVRTTRSIVHIGQMDSGTLSLYSPPYSG